MSVTVKVEYEAQIRKMAQSQSEMVILQEHQTLKDLLLRLSDLHGEPLEKSLLHNSGERQPSLLVFINDQQIPISSNPLLQQDDIVTLLSPISGG